MVSEFSAPLYAILKILPHGFNESKDQNSTTEEYLLHYQKKF
jgi:hypothetical protein